MHIGVDYILLNKLILYNKNLQKCASVFFCCCCWLSHFVQIHLQQQTFKISTKDLHIFIIAHFFETVIEPRFSLYTWCIQYFNNLNLIKKMVELTFLTHWKCKILTGSIKRYDLEAAVQLAAVWLLLRRTTGLAPPQLVPPGALGARRSGLMVKRRSARVWSGGTRRAGVEGVVWSGGRSRWCGWGNVGRSLDGRFVVSPQDAHAGGLLLGLLSLLLLLVQHLLVQDQLNVLLSEVKRILNQVQGPVWKIQHHLKQNLTLILTCFGWLAGNRR